MQDPENALPLGDINVSTAREANTHIDQAMSQKEDKIEELQKQIATLEDERDSYKEQAEKAANLLEEIQNDKRQKLLARIQQANERVAPDQEVDISGLQEANVATLEQVADVLDVHAEAAGQAVTNQTQQPDLSTIEGAEAGQDGSLEDQLAQTAEAMGLSRGWDQLEADGFEGPELTANTGGSDDPADRLASAIQDITNSQVN